MDNVFNKLFNDQRKELERPDSEPIKSTTDIGKFHFRTNTRKILSRKYNYSIIVTHYCQEGEWQCMGLKHTLTE